MVNLVENLEESAVPRKQSYIYLYWYQKVLLQYQLISTNRLMDLNLTELEAKKKLYLNMHQTLKKVQGINTKSIFLIGQIRSGKSTTMNWLKDHQSLIGKGSELKLFYQVRNKQDKTLASIDHKFSSVTLVQNMMNIEQLGESVSLIDFPGFNENRKQIQILTCGFVIKSCFIHSKQVKFILVFNNHGFRQHSGAQFIATIKNFVKLFKHNQISNEEKNKIFSSVSILITAVNYVDESKAINQYLKTLAESLSHLKDMSRKNSQISEIFNFAEQMLTNIIENRRLQLFKEAIVDKSPQKSRIIENLNLLKWNYFDISKLKDDYLSFPLAQNFSKMAEPQKKKVVDAILWKFNEFKVLQRLLGNIIEEYVKQPLKRYQNLQVIFEQLKNCINDNICHDDVPIFQQGNLQQQSEDQQLHPLASLYSILQLFDISQCCKLDGDRQLQEKQRNQNYCDYLLNEFLLPTLNIFATVFGVNSQQKYIFTTISYIFLNL